MSRHKNWILILAVLGASLLLVGVGVFLLLLPDGIPPQAVLRLELSKELPEARSQEFLNRVLGWQETTVYDVVRALEAASEDDRIEAVTVRITGLRCGLGRAQELRQALARVRGSGRYVAVLLENGDLLDYYIASAADEVFLVPGGSLNITGLAMVVPFLRGTLEKIGIAPDFVTMGADKVAPEVYTEREMSPAMRVNLERVAGRLFSWILGELTEDREISRERWQEMVDTGYIPAVTAQERGVVDDLLYADQVRDRAVERSGGELEDVSLRDYMEELEPGWFADPPRIALVYANGLILFGDSYESQWNQTVTGAATLARIFREIREDDDLEAVVLRIDSPGGSAAASDVIWREVSLTREKKPVVVSMGDYAASGGYYIAVAADHVVAQPATITGSIGAFSGKFSFQGLYDWIGMNWGVVKRGRNADMFLDIEPWTEEQRQLVRAELQGVYDRFVDVVAEGRGLDREATLELATGRSFTGEEARELGLVDSLGGLPEAIQEARRRAGLEAGESAPIEVFPRSPGWFSAVTGNMVVSGADSQPLPGLPDDLLREAGNLEALEAEGVAAYWPARLRRPRR